MRDYVFERLWAQREYLDTLSKEEKDKVISKELKAFNDMVDAKEQKVKRLQALVFEDEFMKKLKNRK